MVSRRQPCEGGNKIGLERRAVRIKAGAALLVDQPADCIRECTDWIVRCGTPDRFDVQTPPRSQPLQRIVEPRPHGHEFFGAGAFEIGTAKAGAGLKRAILVEDHARRDEERPGQMIGEMGGASAKLIEEAHGCVLTRRVDREG
jgi:hypothetical protein